MNQAKIWLVVNPNHGLPLFLGTVLTISQRGRSFPAEVVKGPFYRRP